MNASDRGRDAEPAAQPTAANLHDASGALDTKLATIRPPKERVTQTPSHNWSVATVFAVGFGLLFAMLGPLLILNTSIVQAQRQDAAMLWYLQVCAFAGLLLAGVGQVFRAASHNAERGSTGNRWDGVGKVTGVFGWSLGLTPALVTAIVNGTLDSDGTVAYLILMLVGLAIIAAAFKLLGLRTVKDGIGKLLGRKQAGAVKPAPDSAGH